MKKFIILVFTMLFYNSNCQKKILKASKINHTFTINGLLDEPHWENATIAKDFVMLDPDNGTPENVNRKTEVKILYDHQALYIGATLHDHEPETILREIAPRDDIGTSDYFGVFLNGYNDGQQEFRFFVTAAGVQLECSASETDGEDFSWNAIWESDVKITKTGWTVEMKIPYAALRFPPKAIQTWGLNFIREVRKERFKYTWSFIDRKLGNVMPQAGILEGIENIQTPTRLFFIPYASSYFSINDNKQNQTQKIGMDIKYGINDAFTLDAILVPDFGQAAFDQVVLNLGPFEQQFNENRPFFTEGTDLFNKGNLLYTRRIGGEPFLYPETSDSEKIVNYPNTINLLNAAKISGRTDDGLGIGFLNAVTERTEVNISDINTNNVRSELISPLTNYNVTVFDQRFGTNSSATFVNTNVTREGSYKDANVAAILFDVNTKGNKYNFSGSAKSSTIYNVKSSNGYFTDFNFAKKFGKWRYSIGSEYSSKDYDINDLGINFVNNYQAFYGNTNYRILKPTKLFNSFNTSINFYTQFHNDFGKIQEFSIYYNFNSTSKKNDYYGFGFYIQPIPVHDYFEPRVQDRFLINPEVLNIWLYFSSNYNRKFAIDFNPDFSKSNQDNRKSLGLSISPRYRVNNKLAFTYTFDYKKNYNEIGWVDFFNSDIILAKRDRTTFTNNLNVKYTISPKMSINCNGRYYWSLAEINQYQNLLEDGTFSPNETYDLNKNNNFKLFNFDLSYSWWFAPGSQITALYRNNSQNNNRIIDNSFSKNFSQLFENNLNHTFSVSVRYFLDYNYVKNLIKRNIS
jgi:hypothetical protein